MHFATCCEQRDASAGKTVAMAATEDATGSSVIQQTLLFLPRDACSAKNGIAVVCCPSVTLTIFIG